MTQDEKITNVEMAENMIPDDQLDGVSGGDEPMPEGLRRYVYNEIV